MPTRARPWHRKMKSAWRIGTRPVRTATAFARVRPDFLIIGAMRCGTTTLHGYMRRHPNVRMSSPKEVHYFDRHYDRGDAWYLGHFPLAVERWVAERRGNPLVAGEATPVYLFDPLVPPRVKSTLPDARFLLLFRNPIDRAYSHYQRSYRIRRETHSFEEAIEAEQARLALGGDDHHDPEKAYLERGWYAQQFQRWLQLFPRDRFLVLRSEEMFRDPAATCRGVSGFLEIPDFPAVAPHRRNAGSYAPMREDTRARLRAHFDSHNRALYELTGIDFGWR